MSKTAEAPSTGATWLTYRQAQLHANIGRTKLTELLNSGEVRAARVGRGVRISRESLDEFMGRNPYRDSE